MGPFEQMVEEIFIAGVSVPRYEVDVVTDSNSDQDDVISAIKKSPRVGRLFVLGPTRLTVEVTSREARSRIEAQKFVGKLLRRAGLRADVRRAA